MFAKREPEPSAMADTEPPAAQPSTLPVSFQGKEARRKRWPVPDLSTPRIVSFGVRTVTMEGRRGQQPRTFEIEGGYDVVTTSRTFWRNGPNDPWVENDVSDKPNTTVVETGVWVRRHDPKRYDTGVDKSNKVQKFPPLTQGQRDAAAVVRGVMMVDQT